MSNRTPLKKKHNFAHLKKAQRQLFADTDSEPEPEPKGPNKLELLKQLYESNNYPSKTRLYLIQRDAEVGLTKKQVTEWIEQQEVHQVTARDVKQKKFNTVLAPSVNSNWMIDIIVYDRFKINNYQYIMNCVDVKSRFAYGVAMTRKTKAAAITAMQQVFKKMGRVPEELQMDKGSEFISHEFMAAMKEAGVKTLWYAEVGDIKKMSVVERHNRTLSDMFAKWRQATGRRDWYKVLDQMYETYNNTPHSTIKAKPVDVWKGTDVNKQTVIRMKDNFAVGDRVRVKQIKKVFTKGDAIKYSRQVYIISEKRGLKYVIVDSKGEALSRRYPSHELRKANTVEKAELPAIEKKTKKLEKADRDTQLAKKVKQAKAVLKNVGAKSKFDTSVAKVGARTTRTGRNKRGK